MKLVRLALIVAIATLAQSADLEISRPVRSWEFLDAVGPKAGVFGAENGTLEAWAYPLKIFKDLHLRFVTGNRVIPAESISRRLIAHAGSVTLLYSADEFSVAETIAVAIGEPGALIRLNVTAHDPIRIDVAFTRDFQLMWPASIGSSYEDWSAENKAFLFGADGYPYAAVFGSPNAELVNREYATNYSGDDQTVFTLGTASGTFERLLAFAGSVKSRGDALSVYRHLLSNPQKSFNDSESYYRDYLTRTVSVDLPDKRLQDAYDWSRISMAKGLVDNPFLGRGLVAGYGPSKGAYRPGFGWFFGRDSFWTSFALDSDGDLAAARAAIAFVARFQRADGRVPHEISQSASLVDWFKQFPYGYASADATPLFIIAVHDYVEASGDTAFAKELWPKLTKALDFMRSTFDEAGFPKNAGVGHGWVEGGPLRPPARTEFYQAGCYVEAVRGLARLAEVTGHSSVAAELSREFTAKRTKLNDLYWLADAGYFAFAIGNDGRPMRDLSVLSTVPMWFGLLDENRAQSTIQRLASPDVATDWGMRIISSRNPIYDPSGYHFGSVWPLFTGWASVGEYRDHMAEAGLANLRANASLTLDGADGNTTEVLSGATYSPLTTASPHQIWSAAMVVSPLLRGLLGLNVDAPRNRITLAPHLPADWDSVTIRNVHLANGSADFRLHRSTGDMTLDVDNHGAAFDLEFSPALPPSAKITSASVKFTKETHATDWHPRMETRVNPGHSTLTLQYQGWFGYSVPFSPPQLAEPSAALKVISERWASNGSALDLTVAGRAGRDYPIEIFGAIPVDITGTHLSQGAREAIVHTPEGDPAAYTTAKIHLALTR